MAWDKTIPANNELLSNFPALCRANWEALEAGTTAALKITDAKIADGANISPNKLAEINTPNKVSGAAFKSLSSIPSGAGVIPDANVPHKLGADASDTTPQFLDSLIDTNVFQISAGDLLQLKDLGVETEKLEGGAASPGNSKYYGTNGGGTKGFFDFPSSGIIVDVHKAETTALQSLSSTSYVDVTGMSVTYTPTNGSDHVLILFHASRNQSSGETNFYLDIDGALQTPTSSTMSGSGYTIMFLCKATQLSAVSHTIKIKAKVTSGSNSIRDRALIVVEFQQQ